MMFYVVSKVEIKEVPKPKVIVGLLSLDELIVFSNDVNSGRVRSNWWKAGDQKEKEGVGSPYLIDDIVSDKYEKIVKSLQLAKTWIFHEDGSKCVEEFDDDIEHIFIPFVFFG